MGETSPATDHKPALLSHTYGHYLQQKAVYYHATLHLIQVSSNCPSFINENIDLIFDEYLFGTQNATFQFSSLIIIHNNYCLK